MNKIGIIIAGPIRSYFLKKGMEYTGNLIDLVPVIYNNEKLFRFVHFSDEKRNQVNTEVNVESRLIPLRLKKTIV